MFSKKWRTSERKYGVLIERDVSIPMSDGIQIDCDVFRPDHRGKFPAILGVHAYNKSWQSAPSLGRGIDVLNASIEAGDSNFFVRRGYAHVIANVRGTGRSGGEFQNYGPREVEDTCEIIEWIANQPWCDGNVGMYGVSYFAIAALQAASRKPPHLKAIFAPFAYTDFYRHKYYHGGILAHDFVCGWANRVFKRRSGNKTPWTSWCRKKWGDVKYREAIAEALEDEEIRAIPALCEALSDPEKNANPLIVDVILNRFDGEYWQERNVNLESIETPAYLGACWGTYGLHLPGAFAAWEKIKAPKLMRIGPPIYLDRPLYQYQYEALRWFDYWLKGMETGIMEEPPIMLFVMGTDGWKTVTEWPLLETRWTPFYLHANGLLSEHEFWPNEGGTSFEDHPFGPHGELSFYSPPLVENTEVIGPITLTLYASTTAQEVLWFVSLLDIGPEGDETLLTRGWLRGTQRAVDPEKSKPWEPFHLHTKRDPLTPGEIYEFNINLVPTGNLFKAGHRIGLRIRCVDDEKPKNFLEAIGQGHVWGQTPAWITVFHDADHPSCLYLPITRGNIIGTYLSGGNLPPHQ